MTRSYSASQFLFQLDNGAPDPGILRSVSGGGIKGEVINEGPGSDLHRIKHVGVVEIEPIELELGMSISKPVLGWINDSWEKKFARHDGAIIHADFGYKERLVQTFYQALIAETRFPTLDGSSKEPSYLTVRLQPETTKIEKGDNQQIKGIGEPDQKKWSPSNFRLTIGNMNCSQVNKIDGFAVKQKIKQFYSGENRYPELEPTDVEFDNLTIYTALTHADQFIKWHEDYIVRGGLESKNERQGSIEFLDPSCTEVLFTVELKNLGIFGLTVEKSQAGQDEIKRCKIELYVESMALSFQ